MCGVRQAQRVGEYSRTRNILVYSVSRCSILKVAVRLSPSGLDLRDLANQISKGWKHMASTSSLIGPRGGKDYQLPNYPTVVSWLAWQDFQSFSPSFADRFSQFLRPAVQSVWCVWQLSHSSTACFKPHCLLRPSTIDRGSQSHPTHEASAGTLLAQQRRRQRPRRSAGDMSPR